MLCSINLKTSKIDIKIENNSAVITGGHFGEIKLLEAALFNMRIKNLESSENIFLNSKSDWENVKFSEDVLLTRTADAGVVYMSINNPDLNGISYTSKKRIAQTYDSGWFSAEKPVELAPGMNYNVWVKPKQNYWR